MQGDADDGRATDPICTSALALAHLHLCMSSISHATHMSQVTSLSSKLADVLLPRRAELQAGGGPGGDRLADDR